MVEENFEVLPLGIVKIRIKNQVMGCIHHDFGKLLKETFQGLAKNSRYHKSYDVKCPIVFFGNSAKMAARGSRQNVNIATILNSYPNPIIQKLYPLIRKKNCNFIIFL